MRWYRIALAATALNGTVHPSSTYIAHRPSVHSYMGLKASDSQSIEGAKGIESISALSCTSYLHCFNVLGAPDLCEESLAADYSLPTLLMLATHIPFGIDHYSGFKAFTLKRLFATR